MITSANSVAYKRVADVKPVNCRCLIAPFEGPGGLFFWRERSVGEARGAVSQSKSRNLTGLWTFRPAQSAESCGMAAPIQRSPLPEVMAELQAKDIRAGPESYKD